MIEISTFNFQPTSAAAYREKYGGDTRRMFYPQFPRFRQRFTATVGDTGDTYFICSKLVKITGWNLI